MKAGVYLHIPFCKSRCSYCDFATDVYRNSETVESYVNALVREITAFCPRYGKNSYATVSDLKRSTPLHPAPALRSGAEERPVVDTVYFGGGTPSLLTPKQLESILVAVSEKFSVNAGNEITVEMNPATVSLETLKDYKSLGVNRASFGVQTFDDHSLKLLARGHDANDARTTFRLLRDAGFDNISFDLIAGLPRQTLADWERNLDEAVKLSPEHLSLYLLEIHQGTPLAEQIRSGRQPMPDDNLAAEMYEMMIDKLSAAGYKQYEISNFSRPGFESQHNTKYWRLDPVYGFGVSAHSFDGKRRYANERDTARYVEMIENKGSAEVMREDIDLGSEFAFLGLRLEQGIDLTEYKRRFGIDLKRKYESDLNRLREAELIDIISERLCLTGKGKLFSNDVFAVFV